VTGGRQPIVGAAIALSGIILASTVLTARDRRWPLPPVSDRLLYLQSGRSAARFLASFDTLAADVYWIRAIQHYGRDRVSNRTTDRFQWLFTLLDLATTLDPHFNIVYRFGAIMLAMELPDGPNRPDQAIALLEKGLANNPTRWQYAHDIAFVHYWHTGNYPEAARWFIRAAGMPGAPGWLGPLAATTFAQGGDREGARKLLQGLLGADEQYIQVAAARSLDQLKALDDIDALQKLVEAFRQSHGRYPDGWSDLIRAGVLRTVPVDPAGTEYSYLMDAHRVTISPKSSLAPLPRTFSRQ